MNHSYPDRLSPAEQRAYDAMIEHDGRHEKAAAALFITRGTLADCLYSAKRKGYNWRDALSIPGLTVDQTRVYRLRQSGMSYKQICAELGVKHNTVSELLRRSRLALGETKKRTRVNDIS